jgi:hypothetical protein
MPGYAPHGSATSQILTCAAATVGDVVIVFGLWGLASLLFRDVTWFEPPRALRYAIVTIVAVGINVSVEWGAVDVLRLWAYAPRQPTLPGIGTGLYAVLQALVLPPVTFYALARWRDTSQAARSRR